MYGMCAIVLIASSAACLDSGSDSVNAAPKANDDTVSVNLGESIVGQLDASDRERDPLTFMVATQGSLGTLSFTDTSDGSYTYTAGDVAGTDTVRFAVSDGSRVSSIAVLTVTVVDINDQGDSSGGGDNTGGDGGDSGVGGTTAGDVEIPDEDDEDVGSGRALSGVVTYDFVPTELSGYNSYLDYANTEQKPVRNAVVVLLNATTDETIVSTHTNDEGEYAFEYDTSDSNLVKVAVLAFSRSPYLVVEDNTNQDDEDNDIVWGIVSDEVDTDSVTELDINADSGWGTTSYTSARASGAFAILDIAYSAAMLFIDARPDALDTFDDAPLHMNWSPNNYPGNGYDITSGDIGTSMWVPNDSPASPGELYILGKANVDTDEFDTHVVAHEWGHYFESAASRSDSIGGPHGGSYLQELDIRVAFGEGWGNGLSGMVDGPIYSDTYGTRQQTGWWMDIDDDTTDYDSPGWFAELSVQSILYDLFDSDDVNDEGRDQVALGIGPLYDALTGAEKTTSAFTSLFSMINAVKESTDNDTDALIDSMVGEHDISSIADEYGTGETNDGNWSYNLPVYHSLELDGSAISLRMQGTDDPYSDYNKLVANRYLRFTVGSSDALNVTATADTDVDVYIYKNGEMVAYSEDYCYDYDNCVESVDFLATAGEYTVNIRGWHQLNSSADCISSCRVCLQTPPDDSSCSNSCPIQCKKQFPVSVTLNSQ